MALAALNASPFRRARSALTGARYRARHAMERAGRAWRYFRGSMTPDDAHMLVYEAEHVSGCYSLEGFTVDSVIEDAQERWGDVAGLEGWAKDAAARVSSKWDSSGYASEAARDWALNLVEDYAKADGVALVEVEG